MAYKCTNELLCKYFQQFLKVPLYPGGPLGRLNKKSSQVQVHLCVEKQLETSNKPRGEIVLSLDHITC